MIPRSGNTCRPLARRLPPVRCDVTETALPDVSDRRAAPGGNGPVPFGLLLECGLEARGELGVLRVEPDRLAVGGESPVRVSRGGECEPPCCRGRGGSPNQGG